MDDTEGTTMDDTKGTTMYDTEGIPEHIMEAIYDYADQKKDNSIASKITLFLSKEHAMNNPCYIQTLKMCLKKNNRKMFNIVLQDLYNDIKKADTDEAYSRNMAYIWENYLQPYLETKPEHLDLSVILQNDKLKAESTVHTFITAITTLSQDRQEEIISNILGMIEGLCGKTTALVLKEIGSHALTLTYKAGKLARVYLAPVYLAWEALQSIYDWWNEKISAKRCIKNIFDSVTTIGATVAGGFGGTAIGTLIFPGVGSAIGGIVGGAIAGAVAEVLGDWAFRKLFGLPKTVALENAYAWMGLQCNASNGDINARYRELCLRHHPDKGGKEEDFHKLQYCMSVIKASKQDA